mgnify:CR=1 FL=1
MHAIQFRQEVKIVFRMLGHIRNEFHKRLDECLVHHITNHDTIVV